LLELGETLERDGEEAMVDLVDGHGIGAGET